MSVVPSDTAAHSALRCIVRKEEENANKIDEDRRSSERRDQVREEIRQAHQRTSAQIARP
jgi:hypothetical protein